MAELDPIQTTPNAVTNKFEDALLRLNLLNPQQLELLRVESINSGRTIEDIGRDMGLLTAEDIAKVRGDVLNVPYVDLRETSIERDVLTVIPESVAKNYHAVAFEAAGNKRYKVAVADPKNIQALEALEFVSKKGDIRFDLAIASQESLNHALSEYSNLSSEMTEVLEDATKEFEIDDVKEKVDSAKDLEKIVSDAPIAKAVAAILKFAVQKGASDIHIEPTETEIKIRYRMDGVLVNTLNLPPKAHSALVSRIKILSNMKIDETRVPQDGRFNSSFDGNEIDFRVSTFPTVSGEKVVMRLLDKAAGLRSLEEIGVTGRGFEKLTEGLAKPYGLTLVTGPTGAGKSTTLYSSLTRLNDVGVNIVTLEDPVEYHIDGINQSQINPQVGYTFASGLRSILRQDPDIVMVGEIRDQETAEMAVNAALTGHIVLSTLHTNDAAGALPRLVDMDVEPFLIASSINTIVAQRLARKICDKCIETVQLTKSEQDEMEHIIAEMPKQVKEKLKPLKDYTFKKGAGCEVCGNSGYKGRIGIFEVLPMSDAVQELLLKNSSGEQIKAQAIKEGMVTMQQDGVLKVLEGITTFSEIILRTKE
jgi:type IV pilus assembly protein PilB